ncbi:hypothetical protein Daesc_004290 [Daldinia eschscholtzii]|uniref:Uncharacterized protein n=1 Tax=Daldinia eschscholtzii TaxID=292717 RepID=A0AAX6MPF1_9PEZI
MTDEIRQTPVPVPHVYGQPAPSPAGQQQATETTATPPTTGDAAAPTIEAPASAEQAASPAPNAASASASTTAPAPAPAPTNNNNAPSPSPAATAAAPVNPPARTGTPLRTTNGQQQEAGSSSRATSQHPDPGFTMPAEAPPHGAPVRQYLNSKVTGPLLDGMKMIAKEQPKDPLRVLGEYLVQRSKELESASS